MELHKRKAIKRADGFKKHQYLRVVGQGAGEPLPVGRVSIKDEPDNTTSKAAGSDISPKEALAQSKSKANAAKKKRKMPPAVPPSIDVKLSDMLRTSQQSELSWLVQS